MHVTLYNCFWVCIFWTEKIIFFSSWNIHTHSKIIKITLIIKKNMNFPLSLRFTIYIHFTKNFFFLRCMKEKKIINIIILIFLTHDDSTCCVCVHNFHVSPPSMPSTVYSKHQQTNICLSPRPLPTIPSLSHSPWSVFHLLK
jgi:hypothetical protein